MSTSPSQDSASTPSTLFVYCQWQLGSIHWPYLPMFGKFINRFVLSFFVFYLLKDIFKLASSTWRLFWSCFLWSSADLIPYSNIFDISPSYWRNLYLTGCTTSCSPRRVCLNSLISISHRICIPSHTWKLIWNYARETIDLPTVSMGYVRTLVSVSLEKAKICLMF